MVWPLEVQRQVKSQRLLKGLLAAGVSVPWAGWLAGKRFVGYRNRIRMRLTGGRLQFFNQQKAAECAVLQPGLRQAITRAARWVEQTSTRLEAVDYAEVRAPDIDGRAGLWLGATRPRLARFVLEHGPRGFVTAPLSNPAEALLAQRWALDEQVYAYVPVGSFMQVNDEVNGLLIRQVLGVAAETQARTFCDLYCGSGNFSLPLLGRGLTGSGVEVDARAITALRRAATAQQLDARRYLAADALTGCRNMLARGSRFDLVLVNPPRAGARKALDAIADLACRDLLLCYCGIDGLIRDAAHLQARGFLPQRLWGVDMFPHTHHVEALLWLRRLA